MISMSFRAFEHNLRSFVVGLVLLVLFLSSVSTVDAVESEFALDAALTTNVAGGMPVTSDEAQAIMDAYNFDRLDEMAGFELLEEAYKFAEIVEANMPQSANPKFWLFQAFRVEFAKAMVNIRAIINTGASTVKLKEFPALMPVGQFGEVYHNVTRILAAYKVMRNLSLELSGSILIPNDSEKVGTALLILDRVMGFIQQTTDTQYAVPKSQMIAANLNMSKYLAVGIEGSYESLQYSDEDQLLGRMAQQEQAIEAFAFLLERIHLLPEVDTSFGAAEPNTALYDTALNEIVTNRRWSTLVERATDVSVPDSGEVDGIDDAMEKVKRVQFGFQLLKFQFEQRSAWLQ